MHYDHDSNEQVAETYSYRTPMLVTVVRSFPDCPQLFTYPVCPRCRKTMEREYQSYCDRCGQALDWRYFSKAIVIPAKRKTKTNHAELCSD